LYYRVEDRGFLSLKKRKIDFSTRNVQAEILNVERLMAYKIWLGVNGQRELRHATHGNINHVQIPILLTHGIAVNTSHTDTFN
jgi:hypothetical protein